MSESDWKARPNVREWSGGPSGCQRVIERPAQMSRSGQESLTVVREWSGDPSEYPEGPSG